MATTRGDSFATLRSSKSERMRQEDPINRADKIDNRRRRTRYATRTRAEHSENIFDRQRGRPRNARVMTPEGMQLVRIRSSDQWFAKLSGHLRRTPIWIEQSFVEVTELDRVKTIDLIKKTFTDRTAQHVKRMRRNG